MKSALLFLCTLLVVMTSSACDHEKVRTDPIEDRVVKKDEFYLYNISEQQLGVYNKENMKWMPLHKEDNLFQYMFNNDSEYVVSGHSIDNQFVLLKLSEDRKNINKVFELSNDKDCFFPLASDGEKFYYVLYEDEKNTEVIKRSIFTLDENNHVELVKRTDDLITSGLIIDQLLYYTVFDPDKEKYSVYSIDLNQKENEPELVKTNLEARELYRIGNELYFSSRDKIFNNKESFEKKSENFFVGNLMIQIYTDPINGLICTVTNVVNKKVMHTFENPINFEVNDNVLTLYCEGHIYKISTAD
ncbi:hypothetical protein D1872_213120 [compost metagenome]